jgi:hypothetical protein
MNEVGDDKGHVGAMASLLTSLADAMARQDRVSGGEGMAFAVTNLREASDLAARRVETARHAGPRLLWEIQKTLLVELARCALLAASALEDAGGEASPDLASAAALARCAFQSAVLRDPGLLAPPAFSAAEVAACDEPAPFSDPDGWRSMGRGWFAAVDPSGVVLSVVPLDGEFLGRVGGTGVTVLPHAAAAALAATAACRSLMGQADA